MRLNLLIDAEQPRRWHGRLADALAAAGHDISLVPVRSDRAPPLPRELDWLLLIDRTLHGAGEHALDRAPSHHQTPAPWDADLTIDLSGTNAAAGSGRRLVALFDGLPGERALWAALLDQRAPRLDLLDPNSGTHIAIGQTATDAPHQLMTSADQVIARLISGIVRAVRFDVTGTPGSGQVPCAMPSPLRSCTSALARILAVKAKRALMQRLKKAPQWHVAWRLSDAAAPLAHGALNLDEWTLLPDDGKRFYADPFAAAHEGRRYVFVEEFPYATARGLISVAEVARDGRLLCPPRPVLETPFHLSYPQIFADGDDIYMLPEAAASGRLTLYRAEAFPERWVPVADLLAERVHDATLVKMADGYWIFASADSDGGTSWDALNLYRAPSLLGPWAPHPKNPVLVDAGGARPAGAMFRHAGALWRPVQDCRTGYGTGLGFARIGRLDGSGFTQTLVHSVTAPDRRGCSGVHTWNRAAGLEVVDVFGPPGLGEPTRSAGRLAAATAGFRRLARPVQSARS